MSENFLKEINPREYQKAIFETSKSKNTLVVLPTGVGKTLIALMLSIERLKKFPNHKVLFLAPTRPLAEQHLDYFKKHLPELFATMELFTGSVPPENRKKLFQNADIIFSTPQCVANDLKNYLYDLRETSLLIEDEAHRCINNYDYNLVAQRYIQQSQNQRILGLTASPGSEESRIKQICKNLSIEAVELRTRESPDVKEYLQDLDFEKIQVNFPPEFQEIKELLKKIYDKKVEELKNRSLLFGMATKKSLLELQGKIMHRISMGDKNLNILSGASACAQAIKLQHALELLETQTLYSLQQYFLSMFEQAKQKKSKAIQNIVKQPEFNKAYVLMNELLAKKIENPKLSTLKAEIEHEFQQNPKMKAIIFAQYRDTIVKICKELNEINGIKAKVFVGQAKKGLGEKSSGLNQREQKNVLIDFSHGEINVLCATSIGEEGLDIPEVNAVIFYEPVPSAIRAIQRAGRTARLMPGKLKILITKGTRDEGFYYASRAKEKRMHTAIHSIKNKLESNKKEEKQKTL
jgi:Fanconi anemia group M protein